MTDDLIAWLRAQLDEDEAYVERVIDTEIREADDAGVDLSREEALANADWQRWMLAEVDAKRQLLDCIVGATGKGSSRLVANDEPWAIGGDHLVRLLALPYADREGYREEWKP